MGARSSGIAPRLSRLISRPVQSNRYGAESACTAQCDFGVGPLFDIDRSIAEHEMQVVAHHGITARLNAGESGEVAQPIENPGLPVSVIRTGVGVGAAKG